jgi:hypothetical protein
VAEPEVSQLRDALTVLARDVDRHEEALRAGVADVARVQVAADQATAAAEQANTAAGRLAHGVAAVAEQLRAVRQELAGGADDDAQREPPWMYVEDPVTAAAILERLARWLVEVLLRYPDAEDFGECWAWHPSVVAELLALEAAWYDAYLGKTATAGKVMDWHDRHRPGTVERVKRELNQCSLAEHRVGGTKEYRPVYLAGVDQLPDLAAWWASSHGASAAPAPSRAVVAEADAYRKTRLQQHY